MGERKSRFSMYSAVVRRTPPDIERAAEKIHDMLPPTAAPAEEHKLGIDDHRWINAMRTELNNARRRPPLSRSACTIFKVPDNVRRCDPDAYAPAAVSIGPYHYRPAHAMQDHKWSCVRYLLSRHRSKRRASQLLDRCLLALHALDADVRACYSESIGHLDPHTLASIMLLDGCFIIHLMLKKLQRTASNTFALEEEEQEEITVTKDEVELELGEEEEEIEGPLLGMLWIWNLVVYDLIKLENQIPFFVIETLFNVLATSGDRGINLVSLALRLFDDIHPTKSPAFTTMPGNQVHHLLHLFHTSLIPLECKALGSAGIEECPEWIPSATELKLAGVQFRKKEASDSFLDVSFKDGIMKIPTLRVYDYTNSLLRNLVAFEQCYPDTRTYVTIYAAFMDCMIDSGDDVRLLNLVGILVNRLSTDEAVADLFNRLCNQVHYASDRNYLKDVYIEAKKYHDSKWHRWRAALMRDYFGSPWSIISFVAGTVLLLLTIEQSYFAANS